MGKTLKALILAGLAGLILLGAKTAKAEINAENQAQLAADGQTYHVQTNKNDGSDYGNAGNEASGLEKKKSFEFAISASNEQLNPTQYNEEIRKDFDGDVLGNTQGYGLEVALRTYEDLWFGIDLSKNTQTKATWKNIDGNKKYFGSNTLDCTNKDVLMIYKKPLAKNTFLDLGGGLATTSAYLESWDGTENGTGKTTSTLEINGVKGLVSICWVFDDTFIRGKLAYRTGKKDNLDISGWEPSLSIGTGF